MNDQIRTAIEALAALLDRDITFVGNVAQLPFKSHGQAIGCIYDARDAINTLSSAARDQS